MWTCAVSLGSLSLYSHALITLALLSLRCGRLFVECFAALFGWLVIYSTMSGRVCFIHYITNVYNTVSGSFRLVWFGWLLPVVLSHRHTAQTLFSAVVTCKVYPVHAERCTASPICHYCTATAVVYYCAG